MEVIEFRPERDQYAFTFGGVAPVRKIRPGTALRLWTWPRLETDDHLVVVGSSRPLEDAWRVSQAGMVMWLMDLFGLEKMDAYQLLSQTSQAPLANVVDANYSAVTKVPKALLPPASAYGGMHRQLRETAATISQ